MVYPFFKLLQLFSYIVPDIVLTPTILHILIHTLVPSALHSTIVVHLFFFILLFILKGKGIFTLSSEIGVNKRSSTSPQWPTATIKNHWPSIYGVCFLRTSFYFFIVLPLRIFSRYLSHISSFRPRVISGKSQVLFLTIPSGSLPKPKVSSLFRHFCHM